MACEITKGRLEPCLDKVAGLKSLILMNYQEYVYTAAAGVVTDIKDNDGITEPTGYRYVLRGTQNNLVQNIQSSRDNGTTMIEQVLTSAFKQITAADNEEFLLMVYGRPVIIAEDNNGQYWLVGKEYGNEINTGNSTIAGEMNGFFGYNLTFTGMEKKLGEEVQSTVIDAMTIVEGV